jgi:hypothetical protein
MLKAVIKQKYIDGILGLQTTTGCKAIRADTEQNFATEPVLEQLNFIAAAVRASIAAAENRNPLSIR